MGFRRQKAELGERLPQFVVSANTDMLLASALVSRLRDDGLHCVDVVCVADRQVLDAVFLVEFRRNAVSGRGNHFVEGYTKEKKVQCKSAYCDTLTSRTEQVGLDCDGERGGSS